MRENVCFQLLLKPYTSYLFLAMASPKNVFHTSKTWNKYVIQLNSEQDAT